MRSEPCFGELRSLLHAAPTEASWPRLCTLLESWDAEQLAMSVVPYAVTYVQRWPASIPRPAPNTWGTTLLSHEPCPQLLLADALSLSADLTRGRAQRVLNSPSLANLETLSLSLCALDDEGLEALTSTRHLDRLRHLHLNSLGLQDEGALALAQSPALKQLQTLSLASNQITAAGVYALTQAQMIGLQRLDLSESLLGDEVMEVFAQSPWRLKSLGLGLNQLGPRGAGALGRSSWASSLERLDLRRNPLGGLGVSALARASCLSSLNTLLLAGVGLGPEGIMALAGSALLSQLRLLNLSFNELGDEELVLLLSTSRMSALTSLDLSNNYISDDGVFALAHASPQLDRLETLSLSGNHISDRGAFELSCSGELPALTSLYLQDNPLGADGIRALNRSHSLGQLAELFVSHEPR